MPEKKTTERARRAKRQGKSPSTQAGAYVHEEIEHVREGKHGARSTRQAIAIGLSKARRAGVKVAAPKKASAATRRKAEQDSEHAKSHARPAAKRSQATSRALKRASKKTASSSALSRQAKQAAAKRTAASRSTAAKKAARTKGAAGRSAAAKKAARTRQHAA